MTKKYQKEFDLWNDDKKILWEMYFRGWDIVSPAEAEWGARRHL